MLVERATAMTNARPRSDLSDLSDPSLSIVFLIKKVVEKDLEAGTIG